MPARVNAAEATATGSPDRAPEVMAVRRLGSVCHVDLLEAFVEVGVDVEVVQVVDLADVGQVVVLRSQPRGPAAQEAEEEPGVDRLRQAGQRAGRGGLGAEDLRGGGRDEQEPGPGADSAEAAEERGCLHARRRGVDDDQVGLEEGRLVQRLVGAGGLDDVPAAEGEQVGDPPAAFGLVVDDQGGQHANVPVGADSVDQP